jgi:hypothetical protein
LVQAQGHTPLVRLSRWPREVASDRSGRKRGRPRLADVRFVRGAEEEAGMSGWLRAVLLAAMLMVARWALLVLLVRRLGCSVTWPASCLTV